METVILIFFNYYFLKIYFFSTYLKDQNLHPDEPIHVDAVHRQLNPIRLIYRWPFDKLYLHFLQPTFVNLFI